MDSWTAQQVADWLESNGYSSFIKNFMDNDITGDILIHADHDLLKELEIESVGSRIALLKAIYQEKVDNGVPLEEDDYIPETAVVKTSNLKTNNRASKFVEGWALNKRKSRVNASEYSRLKESLIEKDEAIVRLTAEVARLGNELSQLKEDLTPVWSLVKEYKNFQLKSEMRKKSNQDKLKSPKTSNTGSSLISNSPGTPIGSGGGAMKSPVLSKGSLASSNSAKAGSPKLLGIDTIKTSPSDQVMSPSTAGQSPSADEFNQGVGTIRIYVDKNLKRETESYKSFKVSVYDPCSRILPVALKKYKLDDDWQNYALFILIKGSERCLNFDERPLELMLKHKDAIETPSFVLKHLKIVNKIERNSISLEMLQKGGLPDFNRHPQRPTTSKKTGTNAIAVYEYQAERDDEWNVAIGDTFKVIKTEAGWCIVEKEGKQYWVPASCLVENEEREGSEMMAGPPSSNSLSSAKGSTSSSNNTGGTGGGASLTTGIAIYDYKKISPNEMSIKTGDVLRIHKKYNHWLLAECNDQRGWVPSCYVSIHGESSSKDNIHE